MSIAAAASLLRRSRGAANQYYRGFRRSFASQTPEIDNQRRGRQQKQQLPWLVLSPPDNPESRYLYEFTGDDRKAVAFNREIHLPEIAGHILIGSSQGYLFSVDETAEIHATDPLTGARLPVPSTAALPNIAGVFSDPAGNRTHYVIDRHEPPLDNILPQISVFEHSRRVGGGISLLASLDPEQVDILDLKQMKKRYYARAILSPSLNTAVVIDKAYRLPHKSKSIGYNRPAFAQIGPSSSLWTALYSPSYDFNDVIFHQGRLHAVNIWGTLVVFDLDDPLGQPPFVSPRGPVEEECRMYLVESPDGEDLFLVLRESEHYLTRTNYCKVFKLDKSIYEWNRVDSIGDVAMFLGSNQSIAFSATDFSGIIRPNCVYFTDHYWALGDVMCMRVYNLGDDSIQCYNYKLRDSLRMFNWPPPIWFMPTPRLTSFCH